MKKIIYIAYLPQVVEDKILPQVVAEWIAIPNKKAQMMQEALV